MTVIRIDSRLESLPDRKTFRRSQNILAGNIYRGLDALVRNLFPFGSKVDAAPFPRGTLINRVPDGNAIAC